MQVYTSTNTHTYTRTHTHINMHQLHDQKQFQGIRCVPGLKFEWENFSTAEQEQVKIKPVCTYPVCSSGQVLKRVIYFFDQVANLVINKGIKPL